MIRSRQFWEQSSLHVVPRLLLVGTVSVLICVAIGFIVAGGKFTRYDFLAIALYMGLAAFAWHPMTAAFLVMSVSGVGIVFTGSGGDLLELAIALGLVASTCVPWVIIAHVLLLSALTTYISVDGTTLAEGGTYGIAGIAVISFMVGLAFRLAAAREVVLVAERARVAKDLEMISRKQQDRIADELHDGIAHDLTLILFHARALPKQPDEPARAVSLSTIEKFSERALENIQSLLSMMRDTEHEEPDTHPARYDGHVVDAIMALGALLRDAGIATRVTVPDAQLAISPLAERLLTEIAIEAVTNIIKHAPSSQSAGIDVHQRSDAVELVVKNIAPSTSTRQPSTSGGRGLNRARQRLAHSDGKLESARTSDGWILRATVPTRVGHAG